MSETFFHLVYDGEALRDGEMDVADLAPALIGLGELAAAAGKHVSGDRSKVAVKVKSTSIGSFDILLSLVVDAHTLTQLWELWKSEDVQAAASLAGLIGLTGIGGGVSLIKFVKWLRGKKPEEVHRKSPSEVEVTIENVTIVVNPLVYHMAFDPEVRRGLEKAVALPLDQDGIDEVRFGHPGRELAITKSERHAFRAPVETDGDELITRYVRPFSIVSLSFKPGQKWRLSDGHGTPRPVIMSDQDFADKVDRSEVRFAKGDILICEVLERSKRTKSGFKSEYEIVKVLDHQTPPIQDELGIE